MKKRMLLFLVGFVLATTAFVSTPVAAGPSSLCPHPGFACLIGPVCCFDWQCARFCEQVSPGSTPHCSGSAYEPGCCSCNIEPIEQ
jgi:hypothetical protein